MPLGFYPHQPSNNQGRSSMRNGRTVRRQLPLHLLPHDRPPAFPAPSRPFQDEAAHARFAKFKDKPLMLEQGFVFTPKTQNAFDSGTLVIISSKIRMLLLHSLIFGCHINMANLAYDAIVVRVISRNTKITPGRVKDFLQWEIIDKLGELSTTSDSSDASAPQDAPTEHTLVATDQPTPPFCTVRRGSIHHPNLNKLSVEMLAISDHSPLCFPGDQLTISISQYLVTTYPTQGLEHSTLMAKLKWFKVFFERLEQKLIW
ncbi:hypothetical protein V6N11_081429 [Hibiscus sabdariffa]|uniref:Uncharacterized protein n=1 Tax=Hibiscus sabdariffa TaxID=183260 RepID=A0ABR2N6C2_9ROSI